MSSDPMQKFTII